MPVWKEPISQIRKRLNDTMVFSSTGWKMENEDLDLLNRAQQWLAQYKEWTIMTKRSVLTIASDRTAAIPVDANSIKAIYADLDGSGIPAVFYTLEDIDIAKRYLFINNFDKSTGHSWSIQFPNEAIIQGTLYIVYSFVLPDFEGTEAAEYSFFPPNLLLRCAQKIHCEDKGITGDSAVLLVNAFNEELRKFEMNAQLNNVSYDMTPHNAYGVPVKMTGYNLQNGSGNGGHYPYKNSSFMTGM